MSVTGRMALVGFVGGVLGVVGAALGVPFWALIPVGFAIGFYVGRGRRRRSIVNRYRDDDAPPSGRGREWWW